MKKYLILIGAAVMALSCAKELADPQDVMENTEYKTIKFESVMTRTTVDSEGNVAWEAGDEISLYYIVDDQVKEATATADAAGSSATFTAQIPVGDNPTEYYAAYPAESGSLTSEGAFSINVDASKCDGTFKKANFAAAYSTAGAMSFQFKNAVGMLKVKLPEGGLIVRAKNNAEYPVTGVYVRGYKGGEALNGVIAVNVTDGAVSGFGASGGLQNVNMPALSSKSIASGYAYVPCTPATWTGLCVMFYSSEGYVPAVLSPETLTVTLERGHITPLADLSSKIVFDYWVSAAGTGDGLTSTDPMSVEDMQTMMASASGLQANGYHLRGATFNFTEGTHSIEKTITIPAYTGTLGYVAQIDGNGGAVLDASAMASRVFDVKGNAVISNLTIQNSDVLSAGTGSEKNGAAVRVASKTKVTLQNLTIQNCVAQNGGAIFTQYDASSTDENSILDCVNCKFLSNSTSGGHGGVIMNASASVGGQVRFDQCYFGENKVQGTGTNLSGGVLYTITPVLHMFNKCTFYKNSANTYAQEIYMNDVDTRLAMNNCTFRGASNATPSQGSLISTRGYSIIANTTLWSEGPVGKWGMIGLGSNTSLSDLTGSIAVNCVVYNKSSEGKTSYPAFYFHNSFNQNVQYCIYTGGTSDVATANVTNSTDLGTGSALAGTDTKANLTGNDPWYRAYTWPWLDSYNCPTLAQLRSIISSNTAIGKAFLDWLDTIEGSLSTDIAGNPRPANAMCPGSYQQENVVANNN